MIQTNDFEWQLEGEKLKLLPQKALYWPKEKTLIVADVHFGKVGHFRKAGIAIPRSMEQEDLASLSDLLNEYTPETLIFLGDLFHSDVNNDWKWLELWRELYSEVKMILIKGNHDVFSPEIYVNNHFAVVDSYEKGPFVFLHIPPTKTEVILINKCIISGHVHPGVVLKGRGRQRIIIPCFYFSKNQLIIPAFGKFTGKFCVDFNETDKIFGISGYKVIKL